MKFDDVRFVVIFRTPIEAFFFSIFVLSRACCPKISQCFLECCAKNCVFYFLSFTKISGVYRSEKFAINVTRKHRFRLQGVTCLTAADTIDIA